MMSTQGPPISFRSAFTISSHSVAVSVRAAAVWLSENVIELRFGVAIVIALLPAMFAIWIRFRSPPAWLINLL